MHAETSLPCDPSSVRVARQFVTAELAEAGFPDTAFAATLLVSELITNAVLHAGTEIRLVIEGGGDHIRIAVHDGSDRAVRRRRHSLDAATGRGLMMVDQLAVDWGVEKTPPGKAVWFTLPTSGEAIAGAEPDLDMFLAFDESLG